MPAGGVAPINPKRVKDPTKHGTTSRAPVSDYAKVQAEKARALKAVRDRFKGKPGMVDHADGTWTFTPQSRRQQREMSEMRRPMVRTARAVNFQANTGVDRIMARDASGAVREVPAAAENVIAKAGFHSAGISGRRRRVLDCGHFADACTCGEGL
jgi:hypothetical protein